MNPKSVAKIGNNSQSVAIAVVQKTVAYLPTLNLNRKHLCCEQKSIAAFFRDHAFFW